MTDVTIEHGQDVPELSAADEQLPAELTARARAGGLKMTGEGGLLGKLTKVVAESALEGELDDHLGYQKNHPAGRNSGNSRNGHRASYYRYRAGGDQRAAGPGFQLRPKNRRQTAAAADRRR